MKTDMLTYFNTRADVTEERRIALALVLALGQRDYSYDEIKRQVYRLNESAAYRASCGVQCDGE